MLHSGAAAAAAVEVMSVGAARLIAGLCAASAAVIAVKGGSERVEGMAAVIVPVMAGVYAAGAAAVIVKNADMLLPSIKAVFSGAFSGAALRGGTKGAAVRAMTWGLRRGLFSNEAGLGSSPMAYVNGNDSAFDKGFLGVFEVFADTMVICTLTGFAILTSGAAGTAAETCLDAFAAVLGRRGAAVFMAACVSMFALSSVVTWSMYGQRCAEYLGPAAGRAYAVMFPAACFAGAFVPVGASVAAGDAANAVMVFANVPALVLLSGRVRVMTAEYFSEVKKRAVR